MVEAAAHASCMLTMIILTDCAATYKPPVDIEQSGVSQAKHDSDLSDCRTQASNLSLAYQQGRNPVRTFGANGLNANQAATYDDRNADDVYLISQPGGVKKFLDLCMQRKGYQFAD
jgi:hypothetical protein